jgi:hypothetical protein
MFRFLPQFPISYLTISKAVVVLAQIKKLSNMDSNIYNILVMAHSVGRWILLLLLLVAIFKSIGAGNRPFTAGHAKTGLFLTIIADIMLLLGLYLWFAGAWGYGLIQAKGGVGEVMKDPVSRFYAVEHIAGMLIAIILLHVGKAQSKKNRPDKIKHRRTVIFYVLALLIILISIPWPFRLAGEGRGWF